MKKILILSYADDVHARFVAKRARDSDISVTQIDLATFPDSMGITITPPAIGTRSSMSFHGRKGKLLADEFCGVWCRRTGGKLRKKSYSAMARYIDSESGAVTDSVREYMPKARWFSEPAATKLANRKAVQLKCAHEVGLKIPATCITNSASELKRFFATHPRKPLIMKPAGSALVMLSEDPEHARNLLIFTRIIDRKQILKNICRLKCCPLIFQEAIEKDSDIRVTIIDDKAFAASLTLEGCKIAGNTDWRNEGTRLQYERHLLPKDIERKCISVVKKLGLRFGCIDLAFSATSGYTFFEINPQGQWLPSEQKLGYDISGELISRLSS